MWSTTVLNRSVPEKEFRGPAASGYIKQVPHLFATELKIIPQFYYYPNYFKEEYKYLASIYHILTGFFCGVLFFAKFCG